MRRVVVNEALMWLRRRHTFVALDRVDDIPEEADVSEVSRLEAEDIYNLITQLPVGYRTVFNLYVIEGYSHQEIAGMLDISESTSRTQLHKAKSSLKKILTQEGFNYGT
jgi:RNA polymerase sigma-70 factor (ECF subfamily)